MNEKLIIKKIQALMHDPPEKPIILGRIAHEGRAKEIMESIIKEVWIPEDVKTADHIASASDRIDLPKDEKFVTDFCANPAINHPLSGKEFDLKSFANLDIKNVTSAVDRVIVFLADKYKESKESLYLALWRELIDYLIKDPIEEKNDSAKLGQLWELLPADTRIPDHSIWEHKRITSAIAGALPNPAFLLLTIGPVQEFIATARKTQDLWAGSYLLSYLSWIAMKVVVEEFGPDSLIFPDLCRQPFADIWLINDKKLSINKPDSEKLSSPTLPNRFLAIVSAKFVKDIAEKAKECVRKTFQDACEAVKEKMEDKCGIQSSSEWENIWERQTANFIECYWSVITFNNVKKLEDFIREYKNLMGIEYKWEFDDLLKVYEKGFTPNIGTAYGQIYKLIEKMTGSRKSLRDFSQHNEPNHKCTLCGVREPVHPGIYNKNNCSEHFGSLRGFWHEKVMPAFPDIRRSERLCGVCITKRLSSKYYFKEKLNFEIRDNFPSVSMVATSAFKLRVIENINFNSLLIKIGIYIEAIKNLMGDDRWSGIPVPMVIRACHDNISKDFARIEGDWLYGEAFDNKESLWEENSHRLSREDFEELLKNAKLKQKELFDVIKNLDRGKSIENKIREPSKYYAVLLMDGDNMGKWLSGEFAPEIEKILHSIVKNRLKDNHDWKDLLKYKRPLSPSLHLAMSKALRDFSLHVAREIVEKDHLGKLVYAGGDDVLGFVSLRDLPDVMRKLRAYFSGNIKVDEETNRIDIDFEKGSGFIPIDTDGFPINIEKSKDLIKGFRLSMGTSATASMGVVIAHHNSNLSQVLDEVRQCEKEAKKLKDKNAFCIALAKRAGGTEYFKAKWFYGSNPAFETIPLLSEWSDTFYKDFMSPKFVYDFRTETKGLEGLPVEAIKIETIRIAERHRNKKTPDFDKKKMENLVDGLMKIHENGLTIDNIGNFLSLASFIGREENR